MGLNKSSEYSEVYEKYVSGTIAVGTTGTLVNLGDTNRQLLVIYNNSNEIIYRGSSPSVTVSTGLPINKKSFVAIPVSQGAKVYLVSAVAVNVLGEEYS